MYACVHIYTYVYMDLCLRACLYLYSYVYSNIFFIYVHTCISIHIFDVDFDNAGF